MLTTEQSLILKTIAADLDDIKFAAVLLQIYRRQRSECSSCSRSSTSHQSMDERQHFGQRYGYARDALLEKELDWLSKEDRGKRLRVDRIVFHKLTLMLIPRMMQVKNGLKVTAFRRLAATLRFLGTSSTLQEITVDTHISPQTLTKIIVETCECIIEELKDYIKVFRLVFCARRIFN